MRFAREVLLRSVKLTSIRFTAPKARFTPLPLPRSGKLRFLGGFTMKKRTILLVLCVLLALGAGGAALRAANPRRNARLTQPALKEAVLGCRTISAQAEGETRFLAFPKTAVESFFSSTALLDPEKDVQPSGEPITLAFGETLTAEVFENDLLRVTDSAAAWNREGSRTYVLKGQLYSPLLDYFRAYGAADAENAAAPVPASGSDLNNYT